MALKQTGQAVRQHLRGADLSILDAEDDLAPITVFQEALDERPQPADVALQEERRAIRVRSIEIVVENALLVEVVEEGAGLEVDPPIVDGSVEVLKKRRIGPRLVRGVTHLPHSTADERPHHTIHGRSLRGLPLLEFNDDRVVHAPLILAGEQHINALGGLGDLEFDADTGVVRDPVVRYDQAHVCQ